MLITVEELLQAVFLNPSTIKLYKGTSGTCSWKGETGKYGHESCRTWNQE
jgi:hypothetical protein